MWKQGNLPDINKYLWGNVVTRHNMEIKLGFRRDACKSHLNDGNDLPLPASSTSSSAVVLCSSDFAKTFSLSPLDILKQKSKVRKLSHICLHCPSHVLTCDNLAVEDTPLFTPLPPLAEGNTLQFCGSLGICKTQQRNFSYFREPNFFFHLTNPFLEMWAIPHLPPP